MGAETKIEWAHHTFNPWWGCQRVSPGCVHCYAETFDRRVHGVGRGHWGYSAERRFFGDKHWNEPLKWHRDALAAGERRRVFCSSMADVFEIRLDLVEPRERLFRLIEATPGLDWMLLTKRPENIYAPILPNIWFGASVEDVARKVRIYRLRCTVATVRFLSIEPLLEDLGGLDLRGIDLVIVGGESGPGARPCNVAWVRRIVRQCKAVGVAVFVKQLGANVHDRNDAGFHGLDEGDWPARDGTGETKIVENLDGTTFQYQGKPVRVRLKDPKGGDMAEWPKDLRVREMPNGN